MDSSYKEIINTSDYNDESYDKVIINKQILKFMNKLFNKSDEKKKDFSELFDNPLLEKINKSKKYDQKNQKFNVDKYNILIREDQYNQPKNIYGWKFNEDGEVININVTNELELTKKPKEIFTIVLTDWIKRNKINLSSKSIAGQIYKALDIDVNEILNN